jgi:hypothetical protein
MVSLLLSRLQCLLFLLESRRESGRSVPRSFVSWRAGRIQKISQAEVSNVNSTMYITERMQK